MSKLVEVKTTKTVELGNGEKETREAVVHWNAGESAAEAIELYGDEIVHTHFIRSCNVKLQAGVRAELVAGKDQEQITEEFSDWDPTTVRTVTRDPVSSARTAVSKMTPEQRQEFLASLMEAEGE